MSTSPLRILLIEDSDDDALLLSMELKRQQIPVQALHRVETLDAMDAALKGTEWDLIISDYNLPGFSGLDALSRLQVTGRDIPFLLVSGKIGDQAAVECLKRGANDVIPKDNFTRLGSAIRRELDDASMRSQRRDAEVRLKLAAAVFEHASEAILIADAKNTVISVNPAFSLITGYSADQIIGENPRFLSSGQQSPEFYQEMWRAIQRNGKWQGEIVNKRKDGALYPEWLSITAIRDAEGNVSNYIGLFTDITSRKEAEAENARLYEQARRSSQAREELLAIVSHDLRNPLSVILMTIADVLKDSSDGGCGQEVKRELERIKRSASRMTWLIEDLLDAASIEAGHLSLSLNHLAVPALIGEALEAAQPLAARKSLHVATDLQAGLPSVRADGRRIQQVLANLLGNAIKFTPEAGKITVRAALSGGAVRFSVVDTGPGIADKDQPHVFERFWQAHGTARMGTGLGLFIARAIVQSHGGEISVESAVGKGTTFSFCLPAA